MLSLQNKKKNMKKNKLLFMSLMLSLVSFSCDPRTDQEKLDDEILAWKRRSNIKPTMEDITGRNNTITSDDALAKLKKNKTKLDLELITQEEYNIIKQELIKKINN